MYATSPTINDGTVRDTKCRLSVEDSKSFFQYQWNHFLSETRSGNHTNLNFISKSGEYVSTHQGVILRLSSQLKLLVESRNSCGCVHDVPTLLLPDWDHKVVEALIKLLYSGSANVTADEMEELRSLVQELGLDISQDQLAVEPRAQTQANLAELHLDISEDQLAVEPRAQTQDNLAELHLDISQDQLAEEPQGLEITPLKVDQGLKIANLGSKKRIITASPTRAVNKVQPLGAKKVIEEIEIDEEEDEDEDGEGEEDEDEDYEDGDENEDEDDENDEEEESEDEEGETENKEQDWVINTLIEALDFFENVQIMNEESFDAIEKPLDDLFSALKYLPTETNISILPTEIKTDIFSYLCDSESFVAASVCAEWKEIMKKRLSKLQEIKIGQHCSNADRSESEFDRCESGFGNCFNPAEMIKAASIVKLDLPLKICYPLKDIDARAFADVLTHVSELIITNDCECGDFFSNYYKEMLTQPQMELMCETFEQRNEPLESLGLNGLSMINLDQDRLINCLFKVKRLLLGDGHDSQPLLNAKSFIDRILQDKKKSSFKISQIYLEKLEDPSTDPPYTNQFYRRMADALCQIETVYFGRRFPLAYVTIKRVFRNISTKRIKIENLFIFGVKFWNSEEHFGPQDLKNTLTQLKSFALYGLFTPEQLEAVRSIAGAVVEPNFALGPDERNWIVKKGFESDTSLFSKSDFKLSEIF